MADRLHRFFGGGVHLGIVVVDVVCGGGGMSKEAMKLAKAWFERNTYGDEAVDVYEALCEALAEQPAQQALDKKAENARELGLDYEPAQPRAWFTVDELNAWADKKLKENPQWAEQPAQQEPVACVGPWHDGRLTLIPRYSRQTFEHNQPLYASPQPAQRKPLTDEEIEAIRVGEEFDQWGISETAFKYVARAIEAAHNIKENT